MTAWKSPEFLAQLESVRRLPQTALGRVGRSTESLPPAVLAVWDKAQECAEFWGASNDCVVVHLPWHCAEAAELHAAGFSPDVTPEGYFMGEQDWCWRRHKQPLAPRRFNLVRLCDETGVSGTGKVAEGALFGDGQCVLRWCTHTRSTGVYSTIADLIRIHGHNGATRVEFIDP